MKKGLSLLLAITILAAVLRLWQLGAIPQGFQIDEAAFGYNSYSILKTGRDEFGKLLPVTLRSYDDYKAALYAYVDAPFIAVLGLNEVAVRFPTAIMGILLVLLSYAISIKLTKNEKISLIFAAFIAISPTMIFQSRIQSEIVLSCLLILLGILSFLTWRSSQKRLHLFLAFAFWGLSLISYQFPRVFLVLFIPYLLWFYRKDFNRKSFALSLMLFALIVSVVSYFFLFAGARYQQTSVFSTPDVRLVMEESIREEKNLPIVVTRIFNNKPIYYGRALLDNYFSYLSFDFLFFQTDSPVRESVKNTGFLHLVSFPFLLLGIYHVIKKRLRWGLFLIGWIVITPIGLAPFISESPNIHRALIMLFPLELLAASGILFFFESLNKAKVVRRLALVSVLAFYSFQLVYFLNQLFIHQPVHRPWSREHPYKELIAQLKNYEPRYSKIVVSSAEANTYMFYLFYNKFDPKEYQEMGSIGNKDNSRIGKYVFEHDACTITAVTKGLDPFVGEEGVLYINRGTCKTPAYNVKLVKEIKWGDDSTAFNLIEYIPPN